MAVLAEVMQWKTQSAKACTESPPMYTALQLAQVQEESGGNENAESPGVGACGLVQLMPSTAKGLGVADIWDPQQNLSAGAHLMSQNYKQWGNWQLALFAYNAGSGNVQQVMNSVGSKEWRIISQNPGAWGWPEGQAQGVIAYVRNIIALEPIYAQALKTPVPTPAPIVPPTPEVPVIDPIRTYSVRSGDTLSGIAEKLLGTLATATQVAAAISEIAVASGIKDENAIKVGQTLQIPISISVPAFDTLVSFTASESNGSAQGTIKATKDAFWHLAFKTHTGKVDRSEAWAKILDDVGITDTEAFSTACFDILDAAITAKECWFEPGPPADGWAVIF